MFPSVEWMPGAPADLALQPAKGTPMSRGNLNPAKAGESEMRGIKDSPPYRHNGRLLTLEKTVEFFNLVLELKLSPQ